VTMKNTIKHSIAAAGVCAAGILLLPTEALAKKPGVLEGKPVVVDRLELRKFRAQITPMIGMSLSQPFVHKGMVGANVRFDFTDWIGVRASFMYGVINVDSKLLKALNSPGALPEGSATDQLDTYDGNPGPFRPNDQLDNPAPLHGDFKAGLTRLQYTGSVDLAFTPFSGKLGLFSSLFTEYDIYIFGGFGFAGWQQHYPGAQTTSELLQIANTSDPNGVGYCQAGMAGTNSECLLHPVKADGGFRAGGSFGAGLHLFITDWVALNPEVHDIIVAHNDAGLNATITDVPPVVSNKLSGDRVIRHNATFNLGVTFYLPPKAKRSRLEQKLRKKK